MLYTTGNKFHLSCYAGGLPPSIHESAVEILLLAHKSIAIVRSTSEPMKSILVRHVYQELEGVKQDDVQRLTKVPAFKFFRVKGVLLCFFVTKCTEWQEK